MVDKLPQNVSCKLHVFHLEFLAEVTDHFHEWPETHQGFPSTGAGAAITGNQSPLQGDFHFLVEIWCYLAWVITHTATAVCVQQGLWSGPSVLLRHVSQSAALRQRWECLCTQGTLSAAALLCTLLRIPLV